MSTRVAVAEQRALRQATQDEARAIAALRGPNSAVTAQDQAEAINNVVRQVKDQRIRPSALVANFQRTGTSISTGAVSAASSQGRAAAAASAAAADAAAAAPKGAGGTLMEWAKANPMPAAVVGGAGMLALPKLIHGGGSSTIVT